MTFDKPVVTYVDNFLGFPVGETVPTGYHDEQAGQWAVVRKRPRGQAPVGERRQGGAGSGVRLPASPAELAALGIDDSELYKLAAMYPVGHTFWRVRITHFSTWSCNWDIELGGCDSSGQPAA